MVFAAFAEDHVGAAAAVDRLTRFAADDVVRERGADDRLEDAGFDFVEAAAFAGDAVVAVQSRRAEVEIDAALAAFAFREVLAAPVSMPPPKPGVTPLA